MTLQIQRVNVVGEEVVMLLWNLQGALDAAQDASAVETYT